MDGSESSGHAVSGVGIDRGMLQRDGELQDGALAKGSSRVGVVSVSGPQRSRDGYPSQLASVDSQGISHPHARGHAETHSIHSAPKLPSIRISKGSKGRADNRDISQDAAFSNVTVRENYSVSKDLLLRRPLIMKDMKRQQMYRQATKPKEQRRDEIGLHGNDWYSIKRGASGDRPFASENYLLGKAEPETIMRADGSDAKAAMIKVVASHQDLRPSYKDHVASRTPHELNYKLDTSSVGGQQKGTFISNPMVPDWKDFLRTRDANNKQRKGWTQVETVYSHLVDLNDNPTRTRQKLKYQRLKQTKLELQSVYPCHYVLDGTVRNITYSEYMIANMVRTNPKLLKGLLQTGSDQVSSSPEISQSSYPSQPAANQTQLKATASSRQMPFNSNYTATN